MNKPTPLCIAYRAGYDQIDEKRIEFYLTILNDLAEDIEIPGRLSRANLCEVLGWMAAKQTGLIERASDTHTDLLLLAAKSLPTV